MNTMIKQSEQKASSQLDKIIPILEQMLQYKNSKEPRAETLARASLIKSGTGYVDALTLVKQGHSLDIDDFNDLIILTESFISEVNQCFSDLKKREKEMSLFNQDSSQTAEADEKTKGWLQFIREECLDRGDDFLKVAMSKPIADQFEGKTSIDVIEAIGEIEGIDPDLITEAIVMAADRLHSNE